MSTVAVAVLAIAAGSMLCLTLFLCRWADLAPTADEQHSFLTDDGWSLTVHRFLSRSAGSKAGMPVILAHGLMMNRTCWELSPDSSMIRALCERGYDVFVPEYRGSRSSTGPVLRSDSGFWNYSIEHHAYHDVPAILAGVRELTGCPRIHWVGHSMGGIIIYLYAARFGCDLLGRVVTMGSPVLFSMLTGPGPTAARLYRRLLPWRRVFRARAGLIPVLPLAFLFPGILRLALNSNNLTTRARLTLIRGSVEDISTRLLDWFLRQVPAGEKRSLVSGASPEGNTLASFHVPLLVVAGGRDLLAPPAAVQPAFEHASSQNKRYLLLDGANGPPGAPSFGHSDMPSSPAAVKYLAPLIAQWLQEGEQHSEDVDAAAAS